MSDKVILFDIDYTLFNTDLFREKVYPVLSEKLQFESTEEFYSLARKIEQILKVKHGHFSPNEFLRELSQMAHIDNSKELEAIMNDENVYKASLFTSVEDLLESLAHDGIQIGILSTGNDVFQRQKIQHVVHRFEADDIHIFTNKLQELKDVLAKYKNSTVYIVDDLPIVLSEAKKLNHNVITVLVEGTKKYEQTNELPEFTPDYSVSEVSEVKEIIRNT